ncbi:MAG: GNAT family N-acetyltransferase [Cryobacterium sp.]
MKETAILVDELAIPRTVGGVGWPDFAAQSRLSAAVEAEGYGTDELTLTAEETLPDWLNQRFQPRRLLVARADGVIVGRATLETLTRPGSDVGWLLVQVLPEWRGRGIGTLLADRIEALAAQSGCRILIIYAPSPLAPGPTLASPTGFGAVPRNNPEVRFLLQRGYRLEQVERGSRLALPLGDELLANFAEQAAAFAGPEYIVYCWRDRTPPSWREDLAVLYTRMSTDPPTAGLGEPEDVWTAERIVHEEELRAGSPRILLTAAVRHQPSNRFVGYTQLSVPAETHRAVSQEDTLVLHENRGHRLGMLLKAANLHYLRREHPGHPSVITFNAAENRHMLAVNEALGFVPIGYEGAWRKDLDASRRGETSAPTSGTPMPRET